MTRSTRRHIRINKSRGIKIKSNADVSHRSPEEFPYYELDEDSALGITREEREKFTQAYYDSVDEAYSIAAKFGSDTRVESVEQMMSYYYTMKNSIDDYNKVYADGLVIDEEDGTTITIDVAPVQNKIKEMADAGMDLIVAGMNELLQQQIFREHGIEYQDDYFYWEGSSRETTLTIPVHNDEFGSGGHNKLIIAHTGGYDDNSWSEYLDHEVDTEDDSDWDDLAIAADEDHVQIIIKDIIEIVGEEIAEGMKLGVYDEYDGSEEEKQKAITQLVRKKNYLPPPSPTQVRATINRLKSPIRGRDKRRDDGGISPSTKRLRRPRDDPTTIIQLKKSLRGSTIEQKLPELKSVRSRINTKVMTKSSLTKPRKKILKKRSIDKRRVKA